MGMRGIIFDLDGVLCYTDRYHYLAWKALADQLGLPFDEKVNARLRGVSRMDSLEIVLSLGNRQYSQMEKEQMAEEKNARYRNYLEKLGQESLAPGAVDVLCTLKRQGWLLAVGSSSKNAELILQKTDLKKYFDVVVDGSQIVKSKPDPEVFLLAAQKMNLSPSECIVVEDAESGIRAAKAGGFFAVGIGDAINAFGVDTSISTLAELPDLYQKICVPESIRSVGR